eukprot:TRINITY_DN59572_c1_g1_i1.p1 TRINITY_DN59572_c1_g1~~TRINITY_DN59572_c1_g1_i1.p1  ORF type:complete len:233 (-),score=11.58 TRINITY_DN59572_c1_g1_i1:146-820(-)
MPRRLVPSTQTYAYYSSTIMISPTNQQDKTQNVASCSVSRKGYDKNQDKSSPTISGSSGQTDLISSSVEMCRNSGNRQPDPSVVTNGGGGGRSVLQHRHCTERDNIPTAMMMGKHTCTWDGNTAGSTTNSATERDLGVKTFQQGSETTIGNVFIIVDWREPDNTGNEFIGQGAWAPDDHEGEWGGLWWCKDHYEFILGSTNTAYHYTSIEHIEQDNYVEGPAAL